MLFAAFGGGECVRCGVRGVCRLRRRGVRTLRRAGSVPPSAAGELLPGGSRGFAKGGTGHPDLRPGFLYPLLRLPLTFRSAALPFGHAANTRGTLG